MKNMLYFIGSVLLYGCTQSNSNQILIIEAAGNNDVSRLSKLIDKNINLNYYALDGLTPLIAASKKGAYNALLILLEKGADPNYSGDSITTPTYWAIMNCNKNIYYRLVDRGGLIRLPSFSISTFPSRLESCSDVKFKKDVLSQPKKEGIEFK